MSRFPPVLLHDEQAVLAAVELAFEVGAPSKQTILNILSRLLQGEPISPITAPQALTLRIANDRRSAGPDSDRKE